MHYIFGIILPSVLLRCWLCSRKGIWPVKTEWWGILEWLSLWGEVQIICIWPSRCHCHLFSHDSLKSRLVCVCVCVCVCVYILQTES